MLSQEWDVVQRTDASQSLDPKGTLKRNEGEGRQLKKYEWDGIAGAGQAMMMVW